MAVSRETMSNVDTAWLRMEHPTNLMMITGIMVFEETLNFPRLETVIKERLLSYNRFCQRVVKSRSALRNPEWETVEVDLSYHLVRCSLADAGENLSLTDFIGNLLSNPLDFDRPLWQFHIVEDIEGGCVLIGRIHHCIADGTALIRVLLSLTDQDPDAVYSTAAPAKKGQKSTGRKTVLDPVIAAAENTWRFGLNLLKEGSKVVLNPSRIVAAMKLGAGGAAALGRLAVRPADPETLFRGPLGKKKRGVWSQPVALADVKAIGKATGGTVNDVLLTAMVGALRRYLDSHNQDTSGLNFRAAVPVNLRQPTQKIKLGNNFGLVFPSLPVGIVDPIKRLKVLKKRMDELKGSPEAMVTFGALHAAAIAPHEIQNVVIDFLGQKSTAVMTNVPGPREPIYLAGTAVRHQMFWVPQSGRVGMGISILSYAGEVILGIASDVGLVPDPEKIIEGFHQEFEDLIKLTGIR